MGRQVKVRSKEVERSQTEAAEAHRQLEKLKMSLSDAVGKASVLAKAKEAADKAAKCAGRERDAFQAKVEKLGASGSVSLPELIIAIRGKIPDEKCDLLEDLVQKLQKRELRLNRQEFLQRIKDIAGDATPLFRMALKQLAVDRRVPDPSSLERRTTPSEQASHLRPLIASDCASDE
jgi:hypothetical protein